MVKALLIFVIDFILSRESPISQIGFRERTAGESKMPKSMIQVHHRLNDKTNTYPKN